MDITNIDTAEDWFEILQTGERSQIAMMTLKPSAATGARAESHDKRDQVLLVLEGELEGEVGDEQPHLSEGDVISIPAGVKHRFVNHGDKDAITFNVYSPPAYPPDTKR
jgi:mannose-6-phosphate isomerase-like protein (cupin superfamily)